MMIPAGDLFWKSGSRLLTRLLRRPEFPSQRRDIPVRQWITDHDRQQFRAEGYMVIRNVLPRKHHRQRGS